MTFEKLIQMFCEILEVKRCGFQSLQASGTGTAQFGATGDCPLVDESGIQRYFHGLMDYHSLCVHLISYFL